MSGRRGLGALVKVAHEKSWITAAGHQDRQGCYRCPLEFPDRSPPRLFPGRGRPHPGEVGMSLEVQGLSFLLPPTAGPAEGTLAAQPKPPHCLIGLQNPDRHACMEHKMP